MTARDRQRLIGVHPTLIAALAVVFAALELAGHPLFVVQGVRTIAQQRELYAHGRNGDQRPIVTYKDGLLKRSNHQPRADGFGHAVDCAFQPSGALGAFDVRQPWQLYGAALAKAGIAWGGAWTTLHDLPHAELL